MIEPNIFSHKFATEIGLTAQDEAEIAEIFEAASVRWRALGLTHYVICIIYAGQDEDDLTLCELMYVNEEWCKFYYGRNLGMLIRNLAMSTQPYSISFYATPAIFVNSKYKELIDISIKHGMGYDFLVQFRDNPVTGGGFSAGRHNEKLDKPSIYASIAIAMEAYHKISVIIGRAAERNLKITETEIKHLELLFGGMDVAEIAQTTNVTRNWVAKSCMSLRRKLNVPSNTAAVAKALGLRIMR
ncbi:hypothetical protein [uncultured Sulfitobacter sp.]|uniref:helix-turn-helix transcriptional regulator n=1 Tax=uncultured Sulfitobacter sp. TaxID=191468 RepID=UPI00262C3755|nr:hypothetical protein [uncultured Sulfitobacter sp.]